MDLLVKEGNQMGGDGVDLWTGGAGTQAVALLLAGVNQRLEAAGFRAGLEPATPSLGDMHRLTDLLLKVFDEPGTASASDVSRSGR